MFTLLNPTTQSVRLAFRTLSGREMTSNELSRLLRAYSFARTSRKGCMTIGDTWIGWTPGRLLFRVLGVDPAIRYASGLTLGTLATELARLDRTLSTADMFTLFDAYIDADSGRVSFGDVSISWEDDGLLSVCVGMWPLACGWSTESQAYMA